MSGSAVASFGGVDDSGSAAVEVLVSNVQFLNLYGSIGGLEAPEHLSGFRRFCKNFGWANFDFGLEPLLRDVPLRRSEISEGDQNCTFQSMTPEIASITTMVLVFCGASILRVVLGTLVRVVIKNCVPTSLKFPAWEGPLFLCEYLGFCNSIVRMMSGLCPMWLPIGVSMFVLCPITFLAVSLMFVRSHMRQKNLMYLRFKPQSRAITDKRAALFPGKWGGTFAFLSIFIKMKQRGEWEFEPIDFGASRFWAFMIRDFPGNVWSYTVWKLAKKIAFSLILHLLNGRTNAIALVAVQTVDTLTILCARPHISRDAGLSESMGAIANMSTVAYLTLALVSPDLFSERLALYLSLVATIVSTLVVVLPIISKVAKRLCSPVLLKRDLTVARGWQWA